MIYWLLLMFLNVFVSALKLKIIFISVNLIFILFLEESHDSFYLYNVGVTFKCLVLSASRHTFIFRWQKYKYRLFYSPIPHHNHSLLIEVHCFGFMFTINNKLMNWISCCGVCKRRFSDFLLLPRIKLLVPHEEGRRSEVSVLDSFSLWLCLERQQETPARQAASDLMHHGFMVHGFMYLRRGVEARVHQW